MILSKKYVVRGEKSEYDTGKQQGFTIIELLVATTVFSLVLLMAVAGVLQITQSYYQGVTRARTQNTAREVLEDLTETMRFASGVYTVGAIVAGPIVPPPSSPADTGYFCLGTTRYTYAMDRQLKSSSPDASKKQKRHVLWVDHPSGCTAPADLTQDEPSTGLNGRELLSENMRLVRFEVVPTAIPETNIVHVSVAYGDESLFSTTATSSGSRSCRSGVPGIEFCAVSDLSSAVSRRLAP